MSQPIRIPVGTLVLVATGSKARLFHTVGSENNLSLETGGTLTPQNLDDDGPAGKRPPESSLRETDEATFAKQLANHLYAQAHEGQYKHLVLIVDPGTLGQIRPSLHKEVLDKLILEIPKTLINEPQDRILAAITGQH